MFFQSVLQYSMLSIVASDRFELCSYHAMSEAQITAVLYQKLPNFHL